MKKFFRALMIVCAAACVGFAIFNVLAHKEDEE